jgi:hypothetical protein
MECSVPPTFRPVPNFVADAPARLKPNSGQRTTMEFDPFALSLSGAGWYAKYISNRLQPHNNRRFPTLGGKKASPDTASDSIPKKKNSCHPVLRRGNPKFPG